jgi:Holliday junction resolvasome RuvABC endonuclease subunit
MRRLKNNEPFVLAIYANTRGFGFALFEGVAAPVRWGIKTGRRAGNAHCLEQVAAMVKSFGPSVIVLQDCTDGASRCSDRIANLVGAIATLAELENITVKQYSRSDIRFCFAPYGAKNKGEIASTIATILPEFEPYVPPKRKIWQNENYRMGMFDALALAFTHYAREQQGRP